MLLRSRLYALAERKVLRKRNTIGGAVNRRSTKNAFSEAASIFVLRLLLRGLKGASSPFLVDPARRNRWCFSGSLLARKRELSLTATALYPRAQAREAVHKKTPVHKNTPNTGCPVLGVHIISGVPINYSNSPSGRQMSAFGTFSHEKSLMRLSGVRGAGSSCKP